MFQTKFQGILSFLGERKNGRRASLKDRLSITNYIPPLQHSITGEGLSGVFYAAVSGHGGNVQQAGECATQTELCILEHDPEPAAKVP